MDGVFAEMDFVRWLALGSGVAVILVALWATMKAPPPVWATSGFVAAAALLFAVADGRTVNIESKYFDVKIAELEKQLEATNAELAAANSELQEAGEKVATLTVELKSASNKLSFLTELRSGLEEAETPGLSSDEFLYWAGQAMDGHKGDWDITMMMETVDKFRKDYAAIPIPGGDNENDRIFLRHDEAGGWSALPANFSPFEKNDEIPLVVELSNPKALNLLLAVGYDEGTAAFLTKYYGFGGAKVGAPETEDVDDDSDGSDTSDDPTL